MAELNDFTKDLETQLTCAICNEIFTEPKTLPCLHTFCFNCIKRWNDICQRKRETLKCPICRATVNIDGGDVAKLPSSFTYNSLLQLFDSMEMKACQQNQQQLPECVNCSKRAALVGFCPQCEGMICDECINAHRTMNTLKRSHHASLWNEFKIKDVNGFINNQSLCKEQFHEKSRLEYYCHTCIKCICQKCAATAHSTHLKVSIEEAAEDAKKLISKDKDALDELLIKHRKELELSDENLMRIRNEIDAAKAKARNHTRALIKILQDHEDATIASLDSILMGHTTTNGEEKNGIKANIKHVLELRNQCQSTEDHNLEQFILEGYQNLQNVCKATLGRKSILSTKPAKRNSSIRYISNEKVIQNLLDLQVGAIAESVPDPSCCSIEFLSDIKSVITQFSIMTRNAEGKLCYTNQSSIDVQIQDIDGNDVKKELTGTHTGIFVVKYKPDKPSPYKVLVSIGGKSIKNSPQNVMPLDAKAELKPQRFVETKRAPCLISIVVRNRGKQAVVNHKVGDNCDVYSFL